MVRTRMPLVAALLVAIGLAAIARPAAAQQDPRVAFVNGIPGTRVDICVGRNEVRSSVGYGKWYQRTVGPGDRKVRFRRAEAGRCRGEILGVESLGLGADDDLTLVATRRPDKVVVFDNAPVPSQPASQISVHYAGDLGPIVLAIEHFGFTAPSLLPLGFAKGDERRDDFGPISVGVRPTAFTATSAEAFIGPVAYITIENRRSAFVIVGTTRRNARVVSIVRMLPTP